MASLVLLLVVAVLLLPSAVAAPEEHLVTGLPGFHGTFPSKHYSGYVTVDERSERSLFYYLVLSERDPATDPVVIWLNGGPGCSSFDGFVYGNGPFNFEPGSSSGSLPKLQLNPYSWSKVSNIMYLDSPAGVGMSYSLNKSDYITGDLKTAADAHKFLLKWFELYPEFQLNPFYISGESYGGVYIPTITDEVVKGIERGVKPIINFKGYLIGNPATDVDYDFNSFVPFAHGMGLISTDMYEDVKASCRGTFYGAVDNLCQEKIDRVRWELKDLNKYNILAPCYHHPEIQELEFTNSSLPASFRKLGETDRSFPVRKRMAGRSWPLRLALKDGHVPMWPGLGGRSLPCTSDELATTWLDDEDVRAAIHAKSKSLIGSWELYTARIDFTHDTGTMLTYHKKFTGLGYRVLIYSGDHDLCIPYPGTEAWVKSIGYQVVDRWRPWYYGDQVAGWQSVKQKVVPLSSCEAEYVAATTASKQGLWLSRLLGELLGRGVEVVELRVDIKSALTLAKNLVFHDRSKHIPTKFHFIRECLEDGSIKATYIPTTDQLADILTKSLGRSKFQEMSGRIGLKKLM